MRKLRVLKLVLGAWQGFDFAGQIYQQAADEMFETLGSSCPQLVAVVFECRSPIGCDSTWSFVRSEQVGGSARARSLGVDVAPCVIRDYEPCSDILEPEKLIFN
jgi:hypothetical protein